VRHESKFQPTLVRFAVKTAIWLQKTRNGAFFRYDIGASSVTTVSTSFYPIPTRTQLAGWDRICLTRQLDATDAEIDALVYAVTFSRRVNLDCEGMNGILAVLRYLNKHY
jgi:hypothetical protein